MSMSSIKCRKCNLNNFSTDVECQRCGSPLSERSRAEKRSSSGFSIYPLIFLAIAGGIAYYTYSGVRENVSQINANEANRVAAQANQQGQGLSRTEYDRQRAGQYGNAVKDSPALAESQRRNEERQKIMEQVSNSSP